MLKIVPKSQVQEKVVEQLEEALALARAGELIEVMITAKRIEGGWENWCSGSDGFCELIGRLEILKADLILKYWREEEDG